MVCPCRHDPVPVTGLTTVYEPDGPSIDVVFVHGFTGHPERTWTASNGDARYHHQCEGIHDSSEQPSKRRRRHLFSGSHEGQSYARIYWPRDLLPRTIPTARVLTYGYDTHVSHALGPPTSRSTVYEMAGDFLVALEAQRRSAPSRPLLFVAHSLGGIFVKEALRRSYAPCQDRFRSVFESTIGIIFFGTPHGGADPRGFLQRATQRVVEATGFSVNEHVLNTLLPSSERLRELRDEFNPVVHQQKWAVHSFQEDIGIRYLNGKKVVEDTSSHLGLPGIETTEHIGRDHMEMCRFAGLDDVEYAKVAAALDRIVETASRHQGRVETTALTEGQRQALLDSLKFDQIDDRHLSIKAAHAKTCTWLLKDPNYLQWLDSGRLSEHHGFLWMKGKAGAGKSTLAKFALAAYRKSTRHATVIFFFFNARGAELEKSTIGMYRSLLLQLLDEQPHLQSAFESLGLATVHGRVEFIRWSLEPLKALFQQAVLSLHAGQQPEAAATLTCFIDALDECAEDQIRDMVAFFEHLGSLAMSAGIRFNVFFSSRHYPHITMSNGLSLVLEGQEGHDQDIASYIGSKLRIGKSAAAQKIRTDLQEKSSGVFMWVVLVVDILNKEHDEGRTAQRLQKKLKSIPSDLSELFRDILTRDCRNKNELLLCIQWVLFAFRPLNPEQLYFAVLSGTEPEDVSEWDPDDMPIEAIKRFILNSSKGLAEVTRGKTPTVQFIHESVRDYLLKENGLREVWSDLGGNLEGKSHERLKQCCCTYLQTDIAGPLGLGESDQLPKASETSAEGLELHKRASQQFPFLEYAANNVLRHADAAQAAQVCQRDFLPKFPLADWVERHNVVERYDARRYDKTQTSLLYILAEADLAALIDILPENRRIFDLEKTRHGMPILAALACRSRRAAATMLKVRAGINPELSSIALQWVSEDTIRRDAYSRRHSKLWNITNTGDAVLVALYTAAEGLGSESPSELLLLAVERGLEDFARLLIAKGANVNEHNSQGDTPLYKAVSGGHEAIVRLLLMEGADANQISLRRDTPLYKAVSGGHEAIVRLLLAEGADANQGGLHGNLPLHKAVRDGHEPFVKLLLAEGADINQDSGGHTPLVKAVSGGHEAILRLLVAQGADINKACRGYTPLHSAVKDGHETIVRLLLEEGADINSKNEFGSTPLALAILSKRMDLTKLLIEKGADVNALDFFGETPLSLAIRNGKDWSHIVALIEERIARGSGV